MEAEEVKTLCERTMLHHTAVPILFKPFERIIVKNSDLLLLLILINIRLDLMPVNAQ